MRNIWQKINEDQKNGNLQFFVEKRSKKQVISRMPITEGILNPFGTVQAGAMLWMADVTATILAIENTEIAADGKGFPLAVNLHTTLLANQREGEIRAESRFIRCGKRVLVIRTRITGTQDRLLAELTSTHIPAV